MMEPNVFESASHKAWNAFLNGSFEKGCTSRNWLLIFVWCDWVPFKLFFQPRPGLHFTWSSKQSWPTDGTFPSLAWPSFKNQMFWQGLCHTMSECVLPQHVRWCEFVICFNWQFRHVQCGCSIVGNFSLEPSRLRCRWHMSTADLMMPWIKLNVLGQIII